MEFIQPINNPDYYTSLVENGTSIPNLVPGKSLEFMYSKLNIDGSILNVEQALNQFSVVAKAHRLTNVIMHKKAIYAPFTLESIEEVSHFTRSQWKKSPSLYGTIEAINADQYFNRTKFLVGQMLYLWECFDYAELKLEEELKIEREFYLQESKREENAENARAERRSLLSEIKDKNIFKGKSNFIHITRGEKLGSTKTGAIATDNRNYQTSEEDRLIDIYERENSQLMFPNGVIELEKPIYDNRIISSSDETTTMKRVSFVDDRILNQQKQEIKNFRERAKKSNNFKTKTQLH